MKRIKKGDRFKCINDVVIDGKLYYTEGKIYQSLSRDCLCSDVEKDHLIYYNVWFEIYFDKVESPIGWITSSTNEVMRIDSNGNIKDSIVESVIKKFQDRSNVGIKKYNTTLDRKDINFNGWAEHLQQELMDSILYLERLKKDF